MAQNTPQQPKVIVYEQELFHRLQLARGKIDEVLRIKLHKRFPKNPANFYAELLKHKGEIDRLKKKKVIKEDQYELLLPKNGLVFSEEFDTILHLILLKTFCKKLFDDVTFANFESLVRERNRMQHHKPSVTQVEFDYFFDAIERPIPYTCAWIAKSRL